MSRQSEKIEDAASVWLIRRDSGDWTDDDEAQLRGWLEASNLHRVGFWRLEMAWEEAARLKALGAGIANDQPPPRGEWNLTPFFESTVEPDDSKGASKKLNAEYDRGLEIRSDTHSLDERNRVAAIGQDLAFAGLIPSRDPLPQGFRSRKIVALATAASVVLALVGGGFWLKPSGDRYATPVGGLASVPLPDGSHITLNTATELHVALSGKERDIELSRGEAFFEVAKDSKRPFVVNAGKKRVIAVGTQFSVLRNGDDVRVVVSEGTVRIEDRAGAAPPPALPLTSTGSANAVLLSAGSIAHAGSAGVLIQKEGLTETQEQLSWRTGVLMFRDQTLAEAAAEFNRYNERQIVIRDPVVANLKIEGNFRATNVEAFVRLVERGFPVRAMQEDLQIVLNSN